MSKPISKKMQYKRLSRNKKDVLDNLLDFKSSKNFKSISKGLAVSNDVYYGKKEDMLDLEKLDKAKINKENIEDD